MFNQKCSALLLATSIFLLLGCSKQNAAPITTSPLHVTLKNQNAIASNIYLYAEDEQKNEETTPSCYANGGDTLRSGHYAFYLQADQQSSPQKQNAAPFGDEALSFNDHRPQMLDVLPGQKGLAGDLLLVRQTGSCNGDELALLALSNDAKQLLPLRFQSATGSKDVLFAKSIKRLDFETLQSIAYDNSKSLYTTTTWKWSVHSQILTATKTEAAQK